MSYVIARPEIIAAAAADVAAVRSTLTAQHTAATAPTVAVIPAAADEVSASIAHLFSRYAQDYQALAGKAAAFHEQFAQHLNANGHSYAAAEAVSAASMQHSNANAASAITLTPPPNKLLGAVNNAWSSVSPLLAPIPLVYNLGFFTYGVISASISLSWLSLFVTVILLEKLLGISISFPL